MGEKDTFDPYRQPGILLIQEAVMSLNTGQWVAVIVASILILGYIAGYYSNRQRAVKIFAWLKEGLETLGTVTMGDKLPGMASGGRLEVNQPAPPLKIVEAIYLMAPRENLIFFLFSLLQGRSDELIVWITYQSRPEQSVEVARRGNRQFETRLRDASKPALTMQQTDGRLQMAAEDKVGSTISAKVQAFLNHYPSRVVRLAIRPEKPHLFLRINLRIMQQVSAGELFSELKGLAD